MTTVHVERTKRRQSPAVFMKARRRELAAQILRGEYAEARPAPVLPVEPLVAQIRIRGGWPAASRHLGRTRHYSLEWALRRGIESGYLSWAAADSLAVEVLGMHPFMIWGDVWFGCP